jgi:hypothetical protein
MVEKSKAVQRAAHHEAGHVVVAARKGISIHRSGMCIDDTDRGNSGIRMRPPHSSDDYPSSREDSIIVLYAGLGAEKRFDPATTGKSASCDLAWIRELQAEVDPPISTTELEKASQDLINKNGGAIDRLAAALLSSEFQVSPVEPVWTPSRNVACLCGEEIRRILAAFDIVVELTGAEAAE